MDHAIEILANRMRAKREAGVQYALMLGAGASLGAGVPSTLTIIEEIVKKFALDLEGADDFKDLFDSHWKDATPQERRLYLEPYLEKAPSTGYRHLVNLIREGYFNPIVTFNFDNLLEQALDRYGVPATDYQVIIRGATADGEIAGLLAAKKPPIKILKLHGSVYSNDYFHFSSAEMSNYPPEIAAVLGEITAKDIVICGYGFDDLCVAKVFSPQGESVWWVNPDAGPSSLRGVLSLRGSAKHRISGKSGRFDSFFAELEQALLDGGEPATPPEHNPFKFLESYSEVDGGWYIGRRKLHRKFVEALEKGHHAIHLLGPPRAGKTSFIRAGVLAQLDDSKYDCVYLRCQSDTDTSLKEELERQAQIVVAGDDVPTALADLAARNPKHTVLVLDQFERVASRFDETEAGDEALYHLLDEFCPDQVKGLTVVAVSLNSPSYTVRAFKLHQKRPGALEIIDLKHLEAKKVEAVIRVLVRKAGLRFDRRVINKLVRDYGENEDFTLAHVQAICHLLGNEGKADLKTYKSIAKADLDALDEAINRYDFVALVEDFPLVEERMLLLEIMKRVSAESKGKIAEFLMKNCGELFLARPSSSPNGVGSSGRGGGG